jgi:Flp pilus assembly protein TadB
MVALRSSRQDRTMLVAVWVLTTVVLVLGILAGSPILLVWGTVGLLAAIFLTRIHLRDTRQARVAATDEPAQPGSSAAADADAGTTDTEESR